MNVREEVYSEVTEDMSRLVAFASQYLFWGMVSMLSVGIWWLQ